MAVEKNQKIREAFIRKFTRGYKKHGFYDLVYFQEPEAGFSIKKRRKDDKNVSLIKVAVMDQGPISRRDLYAAVTYGEEGEHSVRIRPFDETKLRDPIDLEFRDDFYYDVNHKKIYYKTEEIKPSELLNKIYDKHLKSTRLLRGFFLRAKIWFWRICVRGLVNSANKLFSLLLFAISGTRYTYDPFWDDEEVNNQLQTPQKEGRFEEGKKINFLGYEASRWAILFYCSLHLCFYVVFSTLNYKPQIVTTLLRNNFLTLIYVIVSISLIESTIPQMLKASIKKLSNLSLNLSFKKIPV